MAMLVPQVWEGARDLEPAVRDFYRYHAGLVEPWDGPAGLVFTDGLRVCATLDRNGLRPLRTSICEDGFVVVASEVGAVRTVGHGTVTRGRLGPGQMLVVNPELGVLTNDEVKRRLAARQPYGEWLSEHQRPVRIGRPVDGAGEDLVPRQVVAGYTKEEEITVLRPMATAGKEPVASMGDDTALSVFSGRSRTVYQYLKQRFAQVTNPPIDHLREWQVMSLRTQLGPRQPLLDRDTGGRPPPGARHVPDVPVRAAGPGAGPPDRLQAARPGRHLARRAGPRGARARACATWARRPSPPCATAPSC